MRSQSTNCGYRVATMPLKLYHPGREYSNMWTGEEISSATIEQFSATAPQEGRHFSRDQDANTFKVWR
ncbi:hypothetical protein L915_03272 [Phytophthora nicotianae]|uniref:Uncharacterized protein n=3 Tax=Phytophthora nicotianae TaxID=4792 RepID=W2QPB7_PHYN3|nr:hypothetical protein PPTG_22231 [Phytophthora nicotianae INRA-310]ETI53704.1 hypothetical protein F443_03395 [Phytophthora nicotianae P1569]ETK93580.1 hypothetical protein L915_03272 [Phytophthora nicotianae]ETL46973.1 hypothetical protein L916_03240 [Phytophthora nicotianae]ETM53263.1 hypothetical protein L914_03247 [Phytophthora nicotianae]ETN14339.1 hypothetical protein PPTG_22231 [Phytophthora nicotianae INRA-310]